MWFKFAKLFFIVNTSVQAPTSLIVSNAPSESDYQITSDMIKHVKYHSFDDWATIPWNSAYFDIGQPDLKLVEATIIGHNRSYYVLRFLSDVVGQINRPVYNGTGVYTFNKQDLDEASLIMFNHNFIQNDKRNEISVSTPHSGDFGFHLDFEIQKPLSFYIQGFMFYFNFFHFSSFVGTFNYSFLDYEGNIKYVFKGKIDNSTYKQDLYNFVTMPVRVPNLKHLTIEFDVVATGDMPLVLFGQTNIFSAQDINPVPPISPFNPEYERVSWYDVFGQLRNAFRWILYGVVGKILPVEPLRQFLFTTDSLLRRIFSDTISTALNFDIVSGIENIIPLWLFVRAISLIIG